MTKAVGVDSVESLTRSGWLLGTLDYMAPEQIRGEDADPRSDIYSLAAVLFECLTGVVPFRRGTEIAVMYAHLEQLPPSVSSIRGGLPEEIDPVIRRGMAKHPDDRPASMAEVRQELMPWTSGEPVPPPDDRDDVDYRQAVAEATNADDEEGLFSEDIVSASRLAAMPDLPRLAQRGSHWRVACGGSADGCGSADRFEARGRRQHGVDVAGTFRRGRGGCARGRSGIDRR